MILIQSKIHKHFLNNFDTPAVIDELAELIKFANIYFKQKDLKSTLIKKILDYVLYIFDALGISYQQEAD